MNKKPIIKGFIIHVRKQYRALDIFDQVREHKTYTGWCALHGFDMFILTCTDEHFQDLLDAQKDTKTCKTV